MESKKVVVDELPLAIVRRVVKEKLSESSPDYDVSIHKEAMLAFSESVRIFTHHLSATANDLCKDARRQTMKADDVFKALEEMEFADCLEPLKAFLMGKRRVVELLQILEKRTRGNRKNHQRKRGGRKIKRDEGDNKKNEENENANTEKHGDDEENENDNTKNNGNDENENDDENTEENGNDEENEEDEGHNMEENGNENDESGNEENCMEENGSGDGGVNENGNGSGEEEVEGDEEDE